MSDRTKLRDTLLSLFLATVARKTLNSKFNHNKTSQEITHSLYILHKGTAFKAVLTELNVIYGSLSLDLNFKMSVTVISFLKKKVCLHYTHSGKQRNGNAGNKGSAVVTMKGCIFWVAMLHSLTELNQYFRGVSCFHLHQQASGTHGQLCWTIWSQTQKILPFTIMVTWVMIKICTQRAHTVIHMKYKVSYK
jgi:hypothetical protein